MAKKKIVKLKKPKPIGFQVQIDYLAKDANEIKKRLLFLEQWYTDEHPDPPPPPEKPVPLSPKPETLPEGTLPKGS